MYGRPFLVELERGVCLIILLMLRISPLIYPTVPSNTGVRCHFYILDKVRTICAEFPLISCKPDMPQERFESRIGGTVVVLVEVHLAV